MKRRYIIIVALILALSLILGTVASARVISDGTTALTDEEIIERGIAWEMLNDLYYRAYDMLNRAGDDFTDYYVNTLRGHAAAAKQLLDSPTSSTDSIKEMTADISYLFSEEKNPANHARPGCYTVAFTNNGSWSEPVYIYCFSDSGDPDWFPWPGQAMMSGYVNGYGERQFYAFVREDCANIVFCSSSIEADGPDTVAPCVEVQTEDIRVAGNTGYYLSGKRDSQGHYTVKSWALKKPEYKQYYVITDPIQPTQVPVTEPAQAPTEPDPEQPTVYNVDEYLPYNGSMLELYAEPYGNELRRGLYDLIVGATDLIAPGNDLSDAYREKIMRVRNFAVRIYNHRESAEHELTGAMEMLKAAVADKSYDDIIRVSEQYFYLADSGDEPAQPTETPTAPEGTYSSAESYIIGDADGDGSVTVLDATRIQRILAAYKVDDAEGARRRGDIGGDGLDILDATAIQRHLAGYADHSRVGELMI